MCNSWNICTFISIKTPGVLLYMYVSYKSEISLAKFCMFHQAVFLPLKVIPSPLCLRGSFTTNTPLLAITVSATSNSTSSLACCQDSDNIWLISSRDFSQQSCPLIVSTLSPSCITPHLEKNKCFYIRVEKYFTKWIFAMQHYFLKYLNISLNISTKVAHKSQFTLTDNIITCSVKL